MPMFKKSMLVLLAVVALAAGGAFYAGIHGQEEAVTLDAGAAPVQEAQAKEIVVYVAGARSTARASCSSLRAHARRTLSTPAAAFCRRRTRTA